MLFEELLVQGECSPEQVLALEWGQEPLGGPLAPRGGCISAAGEGMCQQAGGLGEMGKWVTGPLPSPTVPRAQAMPGQRWIPGTPHCSGWVPWGRGWGFVGAGCRTAGGGSGDTGHERSCW